MPYDKKQEAPPPIILHTCGNIDLFVFPGKTEDCRLQLDGLFDQVEILLINIEYPMKMNNFVDFVFKINQRDPVLILHLPALSSIPNIDNFHQYMYFKLRYTMVCC